MNCFAIKMSLAIGLLVISPIVSCEGGKDDNKKLLKKSEENSSNPQSASQYSDSTIEKHSRPGSNEMIVNKRDNKEMTYYTFMQGVKSPFIPKWNEIYIEFDYSSKGMILTKETRDSLDLEFKKDLKSLGLVNIRTNVYQLINPRKRSALLNKLEKREQVKKMEVLYSTNANTRVFQRFIKVKFNEDAKKKEIETLMRSNNLRSYEFINANELIVHFSIAEMWDYSFLIISEKINSESNVLRVETFNIQSAPTN